MAITITQAAAEGVGEIGADHQGLWQSHATVHNKRKNLG